MIGALISEGFQNVLVKNKAVHSDGEVTGVQDAVTG